MSERVITIDNHIMQQEHNFPEATGEFSGLLYNISFAAKIISREVNKAGLVQMLGITGKTNVQGEDVQMLDMYAQNVFQQTLEQSGQVCVMVSEEIEDTIPIPERYPKGKYVLCFDPLDGSSNIDFNVSIGSIFAIYRKITPGEHGTEEDILQPGRDLVGAGYIIYGSSTMMVYSTGQGVHGFTLDPSIGEFLLSHENIMIPESGRIYSVNEAYYSMWDKPVKDYIDSLKDPKAAGGKGYTSRYIGSMVSDFHRNLLAGGIYLYPGDHNNPNGKLRLLYEAIPMAYIAEQAGGLSTDGKRNILDIQPESLHQRTPFITGSRKSVIEFENYMKESGSA